MAEPFGSSHFEYSSPPKSTNEYLLIVLFFFNADELFTISLLIGRSIFGNNLKENGIWIIFRDDWLVLGGKKMIAKKWGFVKKVEGGAWSAITDE